MSLDSILDAAGKVFVIALVVVATALLPVWGWWVFRIYVPKSGGSK